MTQLYEIDGYHYIVDLTPYFVLGVLVIALVCAIAVLVRRILASPFRYPYYVARFDVSGRRNVRIEDYIDRHLMDPAGWDAIVAHRAYIQNWKHEQEEYLKTCRLRSRRERQYAEAVDDDRAFRFITCRDQTRYKQANYVKTSYKVSMDDSELDVNWEWIVERRIRLAAINDEATLRDYHAKWRTTSSLRCAGPCSRPPASAPSGGMPPDRPGCRPLTSPARGAALRRAIQSRQGGAQYV